MNAACAPSARALSTSVPCLIPPSTNTGTFPSTALTTSGRVSSYKQINSNLSNGGVTCVNKFDHARARGGVSCEVK